MFAPLAASVAQGLEVLLDLLVEADRPLGNGAVHDIHRDAADRLALDLAELLEEVRVLALLHDLLPLLLVQIPLHVLLVCDK